MTVQTIPPTFYQIAFNADANQGVLPPWWTDLSSRVQFPWPTSRGRHYEFDVVETGTWRPVLANNDGALDPSNTASPFAPGVVPYRQARIRCLPGVNLLTQDQATAGEGTGFGPGLVPARTNVTSGAGYPLSYVASGSAFQGTQVYQVAIPNGAVAPQNLWNLALISAQPGVAYTAQVQARMLATVQNLTVSVAIDWYNSAGTVISTTAGSGTALTGGSTTWVQLVATGTAPTGTVYCLARAVLGTTTTATASFQLDGVQFEQNPFVSPYQTPFTLSTNLFPRANATPATTASWTSDAGTIAIATGLTAAPPGHTTAVGWTTPIGTGSAPNLWFGPEPSNPVPALAQPSTDNVQVTAGSTYTASFYALRAASADVTLAIEAEIQWFAVNGTALTGVPSSIVTLSTTVWSRVTVTTAAPAGAAWGRVLTWIASPASTTAQNTVYVTGGQFELAGAASTWRDPGPAYSVITSYVERWPQGWDQLNGTYGTDDVTAVDAQAGLSQYTLPSPFVAEVLALGPNFFYQLNDPVGGSACTDTAGKRVPAPIENSPFGAGTLVLGNPVTATTVPTGGFQGTPGPVATFVNNPGTFQLAETFISLHKTTTVPGPPRASAWTRVFAFRASAAPGGSSTYRMWTSAPVPSTANTFFQMAIDSTGKLLLQYLDSTGSGGFTYNSPGSVCDGNWHLVGIGVGPTGTMRVWLDGVNTLSGSGVGVPAGLVTDTIGCWVQADQGFYADGFIGDAALAVEFPFLLSVAQMTNLYNSWRTASSGDSSGARVNRVLSWIGWTGPTAIDTGMTASMGPATDLTGATALDALNNIALTENGVFFVSSGGVVTFKARNARYGQTVPVFIFGEQTAVGEWPFEYLHTEFDPSHITNNAQVTQYQGSMVTAISRASQQRVWPRIYQRTINTTSLPECVDASNYLLSQNKDAHQRIDVLTLHPSAVPGLFLVCLSLEIGTRIRINRRPTDAPQITFDGFVEKIEWSWDPNKADVFVTLQCSPADLAKYWVMGALHTTLNAQANSGTASATINALPDAAVNVLKSSFPSAFGYPLVFEPGTARQETNFVTSVPNTTLGYSTATLGFFGAFAFTHPAGSVVCEQLPAGVTDPTAFDASSVLGVAYATILSGGGIGTNTVTVGPLPDSAVNALGSNWNTGDMVWLSPGTGARAEAMTIQSVSTTYPGYASAVLTFTANIGLVHNVGEFVSDPLANNGINPSTVAATTRPGY